MVCCGVVCCAVLCCVVERLRVYLSPSLFLLLLLLFSFLQIGAKDRADEVERRRLLAVKANELLTGRPDMLRGRRKVEDMKHLEVPLSSELSGNLRGTKAVGSVIKDRFNSMLQRNMFEQGKAGADKKAKTKTIPMHKNRLK